MSRSHFWDLSDKMTPLGQTLGRLRNVDKDADREYHLVGTEHLSVSTLQSTL